MFDGSPLAKLGELRGNPVAFCGMLIDDDAVRTWYQCLQTVGRVEHIDLVVNTDGGSISAARRMALLTREFATTVSILVPYRARSAGTLLCASADELVLGPTAELGPIDGNVGSALPVVADRPDLPETISAQDIRAFRTLAEDWFGVVRPKDRLQVLALLAQRVFPVSLSSLYRADQLTRAAATELLALHLPDAAERDRAVIVEQLVAGFHGHDHAITRGDARAIGLNVRDTTEQEAALLWEIDELYRSILADPDVLRSGLILTRGFEAIRETRYIPLPGGTEGPDDDAAPRRRPTVSWRIDRS